LPAAKSIQPRPQLKDLPGPRAKPGRPANQASRVIRDFQDNRETRAVQEIPATVAAPDRPVAQVTQVTRAGRDNPVTKAALATVAVRAKLLRAPPASIATPTQTRAVLPASAIESSPLGEQSIPR
jgi:hypothetical protein